MHRHWPEQEGGGGVSEGMGMVIHWQRHHGHGPTGAKPVTVLEAVLSKLEWDQGDPTLASEENAQGIAAIERAVWWLNRRRP